MDGAPVLLIWKRKKNKEKLLLIHLLASVLSYGLLVLIDKHNAYEFSRHQPIFENCSLLDHFEKSKFRIQENYCSCSRLQEPGGLTPGIKSGA